MNDHAWFREHFARLDYLQARTSTRSEALEGDANTAQRPKDSSLGIGSLKGE
jgi:hypothetical protein